MCLLLQGQQSLVKKTENPVPDLKVATNEIKYKVFKFPAQLNFVLWFIYNLISAIV